MRPAASHIGVLGLGHPGVARVVSADAGRQPLVSISVATDLRKLWEVTSATPSPSRRPVSASISVQAEQNETFTFRNFKQFQFAPG